MVEVVEAQARQADALADLLKAAQDVALFERRSSRLLPGTGRSRESAKDTHDEPAARWTGKTCERGFPLSVTECKNGLVAKIWLEPFHHHTVPIDYSDEPTPISKAPSLMPQQVLLVRVVSFTFQFICVRQIQECLDYYDQKIHPSSRLPVGGMDHWEAQRWFERLPIYLLETTKRAKVVKALKQALSVAESSALPK